MTAPQGAPRDEMPPLACEVCGEPAVGVCNSMGPCSAAFCARCLRAGVQPYWIMLAYLAGAVEAPKDGVELRAALAEWCHATVDATLAFYQKSWDDFATDVRDTNARVAEVQALTPHPTPKNPQ